MAAAGYYDPRTGEWVDEDPWYLDTPATPSPSPGMPADTPILRSPREPTSPIPVTPSTPASAPAPAPTPQLGPAPSPTVPGTTSYPLPGGQTSFSYPDFAPAPIDYPDWTPPTSTLGPFAPPPVTAGDWTAPSWDVGAPPELAPFDYPEFVGPTAENFQADPGYQFRQREMQRAVENAASARGLLATGGTLKDLMSYGGSLASQEFGNVFGRQLTAHQENKGAALTEHDRNEQAKIKAYEMVYGAESDEYKRAVTDYNIKRAADQDAFQRAYAGYQTNYGREQDRFRNSLTDYLTGYGRESEDWDRGLQTYLTNRDTATGSYGLNLDTANLNLNRDQARWGNLLNLYNIATKTLPTYSPLPLPSY